MNPYITDLEIRNFKSIAHLELSDFKKINLFIGRPNVGKSNILEALSLFSLPLLKVKSGQMPFKKIQTIIRAEGETELFYEGNISEAIKVQTTNMSCYISHYSNTFAPKILDEPIQTKGFAIQFSDTFLSKDQNIVKCYQFKSKTKFKRENTDSLSVPNGQNILEVLELYPELREIYTHWFEQYGLRLVLDKASNSLKILKDKGKEVFIIPYSLIADTLQRIIFYKTAVASNENSVLLFEEPEAHAFPPYIAEFTQEVIKSQTNQFMIVTHSPVIVNDFLENAREDLAIFMVDFRAGQTVARALSSSEIYEVYKYGVDLFFNNEAYLNV